MSTQVIVPDKSPIDDCSYRFITLENKMRVLLVSDPTTDKAACSMNVHVGHLSDPDDVPGLAHFLEHMLFLGTEKYPDENGYSQYLSMNGGSSNAYTDTDDTNYYFDVNKDAFVGAMDRFAQFFIGPLFTEGSTAREVKAVDNENSKNKQVDFWRTYQLVKSQAREGHPYRKFGTGNSATLSGRTAGDDKEAEPSADAGSTETPPPPPATTTSPGSAAAAAASAAAAPSPTRSALLAFYARHYSSDVMSVCIYSHQSLDELSSLVVSSFGDVSNGNVGPPSFPGSPYGPSEVKRRLNVVPIKEMRQVELYFPMPPVNHLYESKPLSYIGHLLGHEAEGSVLANLKSKGWANSCSAGCDRSESDWASFKVSLELTEEGLKNVEEVVGIVFGYVNLMKEGGAQSWIYEECKLVSDSNFRFLSKTKPINFVVGKAAGIKHYMPEHVLSGPHLFFKWDKETIDHLTSFIRPDNVICVVSSRDYEGATKLKERWYGTDYNDEALPDALVASWASASYSKDELHLPDKNDLIASDFTLRDSLGFDKAPKLIESDDVHNLWFKPDDKFGRPNLNVMTQLVTPLAWASPDNANLLELYVSCLDQMINEFAYMASMASLHCYFATSRSGVDVSFGGYNDKMSVLVERAVTTINDFGKNITQALFDRMHEKLTKQLKNYPFNQVYQHAMTKSELILGPGQFHAQSRIDALESATLADLKDFSTKLLRRCFVNVLVHGNSSAEGAKSIAAALLNGLKPMVMYKTTRPYFRVVKLETADHVHNFKGYDPNEPNSCCQNQYQFGMMNAETAAMTNLLQHVMSEPCFDELRTKESLGYMVHSSRKISENVVGMQIIVMGNGHSPAYFDERIENFLVTFRKKLVDMPESEWSSNVKAVVEKYLEKDKNLGEETSRYWTEIYNQRYVFRRADVESKIVEGVSKNKMIAFFDAFMTKGGRSRRKLSTRVFGKSQEMPAEPNGDARIIVDDLDFKRCSETWPLALNFVDLKAVFGGGAGAGA